MFSPRGWNPLLSQFSQSMRRMDKNQRWGRTSGLGQFFPSYRPLTQKVCKGNGEREEDLRTSVSFSFVSHPFQVLLGLYVIMHGIY